MSSAMWRWKWGQTSRPPWSLTWTGTSISRSGRTRARGPTPAFSNKCGRPSALATSTRLPAGSLKWMSTRCSYRAALRRCCRARWCHRTALPGELQIRRLRLLWQFGGVLTGCLRHVTSEHRHLQRLAGYPLEGRCSEWQVRSHGRGPLRADLLGHARRPTRRGVRHHDGRGLPGPPSGRPEDEQEVAAQLRQGIHSSYAPLQEGGRVVRVLRGDDRSIRVLKPEIFACEIIRNADRAARSGVLPVT